MIVKFEDNCCVFDASKEEMNKPQGEQALNPTQVETLLKLFETDLNSCASFYQNNVGSVKNFLAILQSACSLQRFKIEEGSHDKMTEDTNGSSQANKLYNENFIQYIQESKEAGSRVFGICSQNIQSFSKYDLVKLGSGDPFGYKHFKDAQRILSAKIENLIYQIDNSDEFTEYRGKFFHGFEKTSSSPKGDSFARMIEQQRERN